MATLVAAVVGVGCTRSDEGAGSPSTVTATTTTEAPTTTRESTTTTTTVLATTTTSTTLMVTTLAPTTVKPKEPLGPGVYAWLVPATGVTDCPTPCYWVYGKVIGHPAIKWINCVINDVSMQGGAPAGSSWGSGFCHVQGGQGARVYVNVQFVTYDPDPNIGCCMRSRVIPVP